MGVLKGVCISREKDKRAKNVHQCEVGQRGMSGDARYGKGIKQVSILPYEKVKKYFDEKNEPVDFGCFGENLVVEGLKLDGIKPGDKYFSGDVVLEITQIGSQWEGMDEYQGERICHPMEKEFIFCKVLHTGILTEEEGFAEY